MPAPPLESEPAMVTAMAVTTRSADFAKAPLSARPPHPNPLPKEESERTACAAHSRRNSLIESAVDDTAQFARGGLRVILQRQRGNYRHTVRACLDHRRRIAGIDSGNPDN